MAARLRIGAELERELEVGEQLTVGREGADVTVADDEVSRNHATFRATPDGKVEIRDLGSRNGTFVDGRRIEEQATLSGGETVRVGQTEIAVEVTPPPAGETKVAGSPASAETVVGAPPPEPAKPPPPPPPPRPADAPPGPSGGPAPRFGSSGGPPPKRKRGSLLWLWITLAVVAVLLALAAVWYFAIRESDEEQIEAAVERVFVTADPDACDFFTQAFFEQSAEESGTTPEEAEQECRDAEVTPSDSATLTDLQIDGDTATGTVEFTVEDETNSVDVSFADEDGWKFDAIDFESTESLE